MRRNVYRITVEWADCDPAGIVFYPNYYRWFDNATQALFASVGLPWHELFPSYGVIGLPLVETRARFVSPSVFGDKIEIESHVSEWRRKVLIVSHTVTNAGKLAVEGTETRFWGRWHPDEPKRLQANEIPASFKERFAAPDAN